MVNEVIGGIFRLKLIGLKKLRMLIVWATLPRNLVFFDFCDYKFLIIHGLKVRKKS
jgi:hypothetical protein